MPENSPTRDQWRQLYGLAARIKKAKPWTQMTEIDVFGVENPTTAATGFISVMGLGGEHLAIAHYPDARALHAFSAVHYNPGADAAERLMEIPQLQLAFEDRDFVEEPDQEILDQLGLRFRGANAWPLFRAYQPGFLPWFINAEEADTLIPALEQTLEVTPRHPQNPALLHPDSADTFLVRKKTASGWVDQYCHVPSPEPEDWSVHLDPFALNRFAKLPRLARTFELDLFRLWSPVEEKPARPFFPYILMLVDPVSQEIAGLEMLAPQPTFAEMWNTVPQKTLELFERLNVLPTHIKLSSQRLADTLAASATTLDLGLEQVTALPSLDQAKTELLQAAQTGFAPALRSMDPDLEAIELEDNDAFAAGPFALGHPFEEDEEEDQGGAADFADTGAFYPFDPLATPLAMFQQRALSHLGKKTTAALS